MADDLELNVVYTRRSAWVCNGPRGHSSAVETPRPTSVGNQYKRIKTRQDKDIDSTMGSSQSKQQVDTFTSEKVLSASVSNPACNGSSSQGIDISLLHLVDNDTLQNQLHQKALQLNAQTHGTPMSSLEQLHQKALQLNAQMNETPIMSTAQHDVSVTNAPSGNDAFYNKFIDQSSAKRISTEVQLMESLSKLHPNLSIVACSDQSLNVIAFASAGHAKIVTVSPDMLKETFFLQPARRSESGVIASDISFACLEVEYKSNHFTIYYVKWVEGFFQKVYHFILHGYPNDGPAMDLISAGCTWAAELGQNILVFNGGFWQKDHKLWESIQSASWKDIILDKQTKNDIRTDVESFFDSEKLYKDLFIPWKRGLIFLGPPGNGKTITLKALMKTANSTPALYVKSFQGFGFGQVFEERSIREIFLKARQMAPCILILEDLDSLITEGNRSYFLNEVDGLESNDGILIICTTNHVEKLDGAITNRPSRFDRKYNFPLPNKDERVQYAEYWRGKLSSRKDIDFTKEFVDTIADMTERFSFAHLKEAFVSTLVIIATKPESESFPDVMQKQIKELRKQIPDDEE